MRLHVVALPQVPTGPGDSDWRIPFLLVLDEVGPLADDDAGMQHLAELDVKRFANCEGLLVFEQRVDPVPAWASAELASLDDLPTTLDDLEQPRGGD